MPSRYPVAEDDQALPADVQRMLANRMGPTTVEFRLGHLAMVSNRDAVEELTEMAAEAAHAVMRSAEHGAISGSGPGGAPPSVDLPGV